MRAARVATLRMEMPMYLQSINLGHSHTTYQNSFSIKAHPGGSIFWTPLTIENVNVCECVCVYLCICLG